MKKKLYPKKRTYEFIAPERRLVIDYSSNQIKKTQNKEKIPLKIFKKINEKNTILALTNSKIKIFSKFQKQIMA
jgi:hypothetical protein